jgi:DeoR/GlpR family transcriptional regulator of sugar metabolism
LASEFEVSEETAGEVLDELRGRRLIEKLHTGAFFMSKWREKGDPGIRDQ